jgi:hypothetical protein
VAEQIRAGVMWTYKDNKEHSYSSVLFEYIIVIEGTLWNIVHSYDLLSKIHQLRLHIFVCVLRTFFAEYLAIPRQIYQYHSCEI